MILAVLQSSAILLIAFSGFHLLRRKSAALRHFVLTVALIAALIVPFAGRFVPERARESLVFTRVQNETQQFLKLDENVKESVAAPVQPAAASTHRSFVFDIWISGVFVASVFMFGRMLQIIVLKGRSARLIDLRWEGVASELRNSLAIRRPVRMLLSQGNILGTFGLFRPCILLPREAGKWSEDRIRVVLSHELAHIKRFDWLIQIVAELTCAVYWFNPLFWWLCRHLRAQGEHACDDVVLNGGVHADDYAAHLLEIARSLRDSESAWSPVLAMARPPYLERRFVAMLNPSLNRKPVSRPAVLTTCLVALLMMAPLIGIGMQRRTQPIAVISEVVVPASGVVPTVKAAEPAAKVPVRKAPPKPAAVQGLADGSLSGTVTDGTGAVVPGVSVTVSSRTLTAHSTSETEVQTTATDATGKYTFAALTPGEYALKAERPGFAAFRTIVEIEVSKTATQNVMLSIGSVVQRVMVTAPGQPKEGPPPGGPQRIRVGGNVVAANLISQVRPEYPESARDAGIEGTVHLQGLIGTDGLLLGLTPLNNINRDLTASALDAVRQWRYKPTLLNNEPVQVLTTIDVEFKLAQ